MKRIVLMLSLVAVFGALLAGCSGGGESAPKEGETTGGTAPAGGDAGAEKSTN